MFALRIITRAMNPFYASTRRRRWQRQQDNAHLVVDHSWLGHVTMPRDIPSSAADTRPAAANCYNVTLYVRRLMGCAAVHRTCRSWPSIPHTSFTGKHRPKNLAMATRWTSVTVVEQYYSAHRANRVACAPAGRYFKEIECLFAAVTWLISGFWVNILITGKICLIRDSRTKTGVNGTTGAFARSKRRAMTLQKTEKWL